MYILYYNSYLVKVATKGGGGSKISKKWLRGLCMTPKEIHICNKKKGIQTLGRVFPRQLRSSHQDKVEIISCK